MSAADDDMKIKQNKHWRSDSFFPLNRLTICCLRNRILLLSVCRSSARACVSEHRIVASPVHERVKLSGTFRPSLFSTSLKSGNSSIFIIDNSEPQVIDPPPHDVTPAEKQLTRVRNTVIPGMRSNCGVSVHRLGVGSDLIWMGVGLTDGCARTQQVTPAQGRPHARHQREHAQSALSHY